MGKRTIKKKRNTRKRNTFKRKKNTLKKNTFKRKKINLRKLGGYPNVGFSEEVTEKKISGRTPEQKQKKTRLSRESASKRRVIGEYGDGKEDTPHELKEEEIDRLEAGKATYQLTSTPDTVFRYGKNRNLRLEYVHSRDQFNKDLKKLKKFLENKSITRLNPTGLLCGYDDIVYDIQDLLDRIMDLNFISNIENVKHRIRKKTEYTISKEKLKKYMGNLFTDKLKYPSQISLRWSELRGKSKQMKSALTISQYSMIEGLEKSNKCLDRVVNINKFLAQFKKLTFYHVDYCMDILFS
jgi:hypothetical protein